MIATMNRPSRRRSRCVLVALMLGAAGTARSSTFELITATDIPGAIQPNSGALGMPDASFDGRFVVFASFASNLVPTDVNGTCSDILLFDEQSSALTLEHVSVNSAGEGANSCSFAPQLSADGRFVAFLSDANNLDAAAPGGRGLYLRDRQLGTTRRVDLDAIGNPLAARAAALSRDGRYAAIWSHADGLIHHKDLLTGTTAVVSLASDRSAIEFSAPLERVSNQQGIAISDDGQVVAFATASNVASMGDTDGAIDIYVRDIAQGTTTIASLAADGSNPAGAVDVRARGDGLAIFSTSLLTEHSTRWMSGDGRRLVFSTPDALTANDTTKPGGQIDGYLHDRGGQSGGPSIGLMTIAGNGARPFGDGYAVSISGDGSRVLLDWNNTVFDGVQSVGDLAVKVVADGSLLSVLRSLGSSESFCCAATWSALSGDGGTVVTRNQFSPLLSDSENTTSEDVLRSPLGSGDAVLVSRPDRRPENTLPAANNSALASATPNNLVSADGGLIAFVSGANNLVAGDSYRRHDLFLRDRDTASTRLLPGESVASRGCKPVSVDLSPDGRFVMFSTCARLLPDSTGFMDLYRMDLADDTLQIVSRRDGADGAPVSIESAGAMSDDGDRLAFSSFVSDPIGDGLGSGYFLRDVASGNTRRLNRDNAGSLFPVAQSPLALSGTGRYLAGSVSHPLDAADDNSGTDVYVLDLTTNQWEWVSRPALGLVFVSPTLRSISGDGRFVLFGATATPAAGGTGFTALLLRDRQAGTTQRVDIRSDGGLLVANTPSGTSFGTLSDNGRFVAFPASTVDFLSGEGFLSGQFFIRDLQAGVTVRASVNNDGTLANSSSEPVGFSTDGRWLLLQSNASNLIPNDLNGSISDVFLTENALFGNELASDVDTLTPETTEPSLEAQVSASGDFVVFESLDPKIHAPCAGVPNPSPLCGIDGASCPASGPMYVFRLDTRSGCVDLVSTDNAQQVIKMRGNRKGGGVDDLLGKPSLSADGAMVAFVADMAAVGKLHGEGQQKRSARLKQGGLGMLLRNMLTGTTAAVPPPTGLGPSFAPASDQGDGSRPQVSPAGNAVVFTGLLGGQPAVFQTQLKPGGNETFCVSCKLGASGSAGDPSNFTEPLDGMAQNPTVSADGAWVAFETSASNATDTPPACNNDPDGSGNTQVILRNMLTGISRAISQPQGTACQAGSARKPRIDFTGARMVFESNQPLTAGATARPEAYLFDLRANRMSQVSTDGMGGQVDEPSGEPTISGDGQSIAFTSRARRGFGADIAEDAPAFRHVVMRDLRSATVRRLSKNLNGIDADGDSARPSLSYTGNSVVFDSVASNLASSDQNGATSDVFLRVNPLVREVVFGSGFE